MKQTLLTICLILFALPSWGQTTFSGGKISGSITTADTKPVELFFDFSEKPIVPNMHIATEEEKRQLKEAVSYADGVAKFTLKDGSLQNIYDKQTSNKKGFKRNESERAELKYHVMSDPTNKIVKMSFKFRTGERMISENRTLIAQIKTLVPDEYSHLSHPNVAIYANNSEAFIGNVSCVEWDDKFDEGHDYHMKNIVKLPNGFISDGNWHEVVMEFKPSIDGKGGYCKVTVDGVTIISLTDIQNFPFQVRKDKYLLNIGPYRDKINKTQTFFYDDWKINLEPIHSI